MNLVHCCLIARDFSPRLLLVLTGFMVVSEVGAVVFGRLIMVSDDAKRFTVTATPSWALRTLPLRQVHSRNRLPSSSQSGRWFPLREALLNPFPRYSVCPPGR